MSDGMEDKMVNDTNVEMYCMTNITGKQHHKRWRGSSKSTLPVWTATGHLFLSIPENAIFNQSPAHLQVPVNHNLGLVTP